MLAQRRPPQREERTGPGGLLLAALAQADIPKHEPDWRDALRDASVGTAVKYAKAIGHTNSYSAAGLVK